MALSRLLKYSTERVLTGRTDGCHYSLSHRVILRWRGLGCLGSGSSSAGAAETN